MEQEQLNIGLSFSGGGYRAATFHLGSLSFMNKVKVDSEHSLLDYVKVLSSVSGGTITALKYMLACAKGQSINDMIKELFGFLCDNDLVSQAMECMNDKKTDPNISLIRIMADIYDEYLFDHKDFGTIIDNFNHIPVKDYTALATDFNTALPFRFRVDEGCISAKGNLTHARFGNDEHRINRDDARLVTMGEALACSSCFPGGFEPMMFPEDFKLAADEKLADKYTKEVETKDGKTKRGFGIMDGGVADNQGIESILQAEERLREHRNNKNYTGAPNEKALDLIIVSDVSSPKIKEGFAPHKQCLWKWLGNQTISRLQSYGLIIGLVLLALLALALFKGSTILTLVSSALLAIDSSLVFGGVWLKNKIHNMIAESFIGDRAKFISHMKLASAESMLMNRAKSVLKMSSEVFLKRQRQLNYDRIHDDPDWDNRRISNRVDELRSDGTWTTKTTLPPELRPSEAVQAITDVASDMGTTLWFTPEEKARRVPQALLADGQYTICYNLLDYIDKIQKDPSYVPTSTYQLFTSLKPTLMEAWDKFQQNPMWMIP